MDIKTQQLGDRTVVGVTGEVDLFSSPQVRDALNKLTKAKTKLIEIELSGVSYMDSSGIATLVECLQQSNGYGGKLVLKNMSPAVKSVFELANLLSVFTVQ